MTRDDLARPGLHPLQEQRRRGPFDQRRRVPVAAVREERPGGGCGARRPGSGLRGATASPPAGSPPGPGPGTRGDGTGRRRAAVGSGRRRIIIRGPHPARRRARRGGLGDSTSRRCPGCGVGVASPGWMGRPRSDRVRHWCGWRRRRCSRRVAGKASRMVPPQETPLTGGPGIAGASSGGGREAKKLQFFA